MSQSTIDVLKNQINIVESKISKRQKEIDDLTKTQKQEKKLVKTWKEQLSELEAPST